MEGTGRDDPAQRGSEGGARTGEEGRPQVHGVQVSRPDPIDRRVSPHGFPGSQDGRPDVARGAGRSL